MSGIRRSIAISPSSEFDTVERSKILIFAHDQIRCDDRDMRDVFRFFFFLSLLMHDVMVSEIELVEITMVSSVRQKLTRVGN